MIILIKNYDHIDDKDDKSITNTKFMMISTAVIMTLIMLMVMKLDVIIIKAIVR